MLINFTNNKSVAHIVCDACLEAIEDSGIAWTLKDLDLSECCFTHVKCQQRFIYRTSHINTRRWKRFDMKETLLSLIANIERTNEGEFIVINTRLLAVV